MVIQLQILLRLPDGTGRETHTTLTNDAMHNL